MERTDVDRWKMNTLQNWVGHRLLFREQIPDKSVAAKFPSFFDVINPGWNCEYRSKIVEYLQAYPDVIAGAGCIDCLICGHALGARVWHRTDGKWVWRNDLSHMVEFHSVALPDAFLKHLIERSFVSPVQGQDYWGLFESQRKTEK